MEPVRVTSSAQAFKSRKGVEPFLVASFGNELPSRVLNFRFAVQKAARQFVISGVNPQSLEKVRAVTLLKCHHVAGDSAMDGE